MENDQGVIAPMVQEPVAQEPASVEAVPVAVAEEATPTVAVEEPTIPDTGKKLTRKRVEAIASATLGFRRFLVRTEGGFRWSEYTEKDDNPNHDDFEVGCAVFATPLDALKSVLTACDFLVDPETNEVMLTIMR